MQELDEEDGYSDDGLDALPAHALHELQENAIRSTQRASEYGNVSYSTRNPLPRPTGLAVGLGKYPSNADNYSNQPSSDYGDFDDGMLDEEMLDGEIIDAAEQPLAISALGRAGERMHREQCRQERFCAPPSLQRPGRKQDAFLRGDVANVDQGSDTMSLEDNRSRIAAKTDPEHLTVDHLRAQVQELLQERDNLREEVTSANNLVLSKIGEISIVRANQSRLEKENEERMLALQKLRADESARHKIEVEKAKAEQQKIAIEKRFLENELGQGAEKIKTLQRVVKDGAGRTANSKAERDRSLATTPKKSKALPYGDGFNRHEITVTSPAKLTLRPKTQTPKAAGKRKRKVEDSPVKPLVLSPPTKDEKFDDPAPYLYKQINSRTGIEATDQWKDNFKFTLKVISHRIKSGEKRSLEALEAFALPSNPSQALSDIFLDNLSEVMAKQELESFPAALGQIIVTLWSRCIDEQYYAPVQLLMDLVKFILLVSPPGTGPLLPAETIAYAQWTADVNLLKRYGKPSAEINPEIDTNLCLQILHLLAYDCQHIREDIELFWRSMRFDFILMALNISEPIRDIHLTLSLLHTSVLDASFAMRITPGNGKQAKCQEHILNKLSHFLVGVPFTARGAPPYEFTEIAELRLKVIGLMESMCSSRYCGEALATHSSIVGRLVKIMNDELNALYDYRPGYELRCQLVNASTRLLFHLTSNYPTYINMQTKLQFIPGGTHKYLIALTRLAFSEGIFYEQGIEEDVADAAHQMLESLVNPQEAEALSEAFSGVKSSK